MAHRKSVARRQVLVVLSVTCTSLVNSLLGKTQSVLYGGAVKNVELREDPLFILGHWRSGTTLAHELFSLDFNATFPNNYCCFMPHHFLLTERMFGPGFNYFSPMTRPMDATTIGWDYPQEDEIAMLGLGVQSAYWRFIFPDDQATPVSHHDPAWTDDRWCQAYEAWMKALAFRSNQRIVVKSPTHSFRIRELLEMFPRARFVYITRTAWEVERSMVRLQTTLTRANSLASQEIHVDRNAIREGIDKLQEAVERSRALIPPDQFCEMQFDELVRTPVRAMRKAYEQLQLAGFEEVRPRIQEHMNRIA